MGKGLMSVKVIALTIPAQVFAEMVVRGKEIGKVRLESIILLKMTLESLWVIHTHMREREREKKLLLHGLFLLYVKKSH